MINAQLEHTVAGCVLSQLFDQCRRGCTVFDQRKRNCRLVVDRQFAKYLFLLFEQVTIQSVSTKHEFKLNQLELFSVAFSSQNCLEALIRLSVLKQFISDSLQADFITCKICYRRFLGSQQKSNYRKHYRSVHLQLKEFKCTWCGKVFGRSDSVRRHEKTCTRALQETRNAPCEFCGKLYGRTDSRKKHELICPFRAVHVVAFGPVISRDGNDTA